jgi:hypothetical protein
VGEVVGVGGNGVSVGGMGCGVEVGAGMTVKIAKAGVRSGAAAAGRLSKIYARLAHNKTLAITSVAIKTLPVKIFFIFIQAIVLNGRKE